MNKSKNYFIVFSLLLLFLSPLVPLAAQTNNDCLLCHNDEYRKKRSRGLTISLTVTHETLRGTVHEKMRCVSCHQDANVKFPHAKELASVSCKKCHTGASHAYLSGSHAQSDEDAPTCKSCHGTHKILPSSNEHSKTYKGNIPYLCGQCHKEGEPIKKAYKLDRNNVAENFSQNIHGDGFFNSGLTVTATCNDCHGNHSVNKHTNPLSKTSNKNITKTCTQCHARMDIVHGYYINKDAWEKESEKRPVCTDCHISHKSGKGRFAESAEINNFCIPTKSNTWKCSGCHTGYGKKDINIDFSDYSHSDCKICNDTLEGSKKQPVGPGFPIVKKTTLEYKTDIPTKYSYIRKNRGKAQVENCGNCHFYGGGGNNVKHGDLSGDLYHADKNMDVHMDRQGADMGCVDCHEGTRHDISGKLNTVSSNNQNRLTCIQCHGEQVHENRTINRHINKVACQTCHIPTYAKGVPTNMTWDWSTAGRLDAHGKRIKEYDRLGNITYHTSKGTYTWASNVKPEYVWFNGTAERYVLGDVIDDTSKVLKLNTLLGSYDDSLSKIFPVKIHRRNQLFDTQNKTLITPLFYGHSDTAFQHGLNWQLSAKAGMKAAGLPYSGDYSFINTETYLPLNHMVSPASKSLKCHNCHSKNSVLAGLDGFYIPGRDNSKLLDIFSVLLILGAIGGIIIHSAIRILKSKRN